MRPRLLAVKEPLRPWLDPRRVALNALLVADYLEQPAVTPKVGALAKVGACDPRCAEDLRVTARSVLHVASKLGERPRRPPRTPGATDADARELRASMIEVVEDALARSDDARLWLEVVRAARDEDDLVFDLRALAHVYRVNAGGLGVAPPAGDEEPRARRIADALEAELTGDVAANEWRDWLARAFTLLVGQHEEACRIARFVSHDGKIEFASLVAIARVRRRQVHEGIRSLAPPGMPPLPLPPPLPEAPPPPSVPAPVLPVESESACAPSSRPSMRAHERHAVELEVDFASDSNFYAGFAENLSGGGVFVATYVLRPIGSIIDLSIRLAGDGEPLHLRGEVRWTRDASSADIWPGMGVRFHALSPENEARIRAFLATREPLFFVD